MKDLDAEEKPKKVIPDEELPDEQLFINGKIKILFNRVLTRQKGQWDPALRAWLRSERDVVHFKNRSRLMEDLGILEADCLGKYISNNIECYIVRFAHQKYACEVFDKGVSIESFYRKSGDRLLEGLFDQYPILTKIEKEMEEKFPEPVLVTPPLIKRRGRPKKVEISASV